MTRIITYIFLTILLTTLFSNQSFSQKAKTHNTARGKKMFAKDEYFAKGGIGIIDKDLYIVVKSAKDDKNALILSDGNKWAGLQAGTPEVVIFYENKILSPQALPSQFDLSNSVVISFENNKIRFFDFRAMEGGYYRRIWIEK